MKSIKIFADSACDLDLDYLKELDVEMIPMTVAFGDEIYEDRVTITTKEFYEKLRTKRIYLKHLRYLLQDLLKLLKSI
ncbi:DegV family protein [Caloramator sp. mosi_1]|uniref:DegV family protein n=1 Tax=Caloramator sp. mosi_1 TaxID=3023090 RepID=UPI0023615A22|nr:DegV family protein [Caloramator sp. mosi_1]WDC83654.1 DegV family protein [Caloramator sp. mosi_1]